MVKNVIAGYLWVTLGLFCLIFFGGKLFFQLVGVFFGLSLIFKGLKILAIDRAVFNYSQRYFDDSFRR